MCTSNLDIYLYNSRECYCMIENLAKSVAKKQKRGVAIDLDILANCAIMGGIIRKAKEVMKKNDEAILPTKEDIKEMRVKVAQYIIDDFLPYL